MAGCGGCRIKYEAQMSAEAINYCPNTGKGFNTNLAAEQEHNYIYV